MDRFCWVVAVCVWINFIFALCVYVRVLVSNANAAVSYSVQLPRKNNSVVVDNENTATKNKWQAFATVASHSLRDMHLLYLCVCSYLLFLD